MFSSPTSNQNNPPNLRQLTHNGLNESPEVTLILQKPSLTAWLKVRDRQLYLRGKKKSPHPNLLRHTPLKTNMEPQTLVVCRCLSSSKGVFSGSMLIFRGVFFGSAPPTDRMPNPRHHQEIRESQIFKHLQLIHNYASPPKQVGRCHS